MTTSTWEKIQEFATRRKGIIGLLFVCGAIILPSFLSDDNSLLRENIEHIGYTVGLILVFQKLESDVEFRRRSKQNVEDIGDLLENHEIQLLNNLFPLASRWGLVGAHDGIDLEAIFRSADRGSTMHIFFTFHPDLSAKFSKLVDIMHDRNISLRLLIMHPDCASIKRRFSYLGWSDDSRDSESEITKLKLFISDELPRHNKRYTSIENNRMIQVRTFDHLPDLPILIETDPAPPAVSGREEDVGRVPSRVRRVLTGFYTLQPAIEGVLLEWRNAGDDALALKFMDYFEKRWKQAQPLALRAE